MGKLKFIWKEIIGGHIGAHVSNIKGDHRAYLVREDNNTYYRAVVHGDILIDINDYARSFLAYKDFHQAVSAVEKKLSSIADARRQRRVTEAAHLTVIQDFISQQNQEEEIWMK